MGIKAEAFDNGILRVVVPPGWNLFYGNDSDGKPNPKKLHIYKDARQELDMFTKAGITLCFFGEGEIYLSTRSFYDNVQDLAPFELGGRLWTGYTCTSCGYPYTMLEATQKGATFQVMTLMKNGENEISLEDEDVQTILKSIAVSEAVQ